MQFLHPWFLLGLAAVSVPIVIHMVFRMKARVVLFPSVRFLQQVDRQVARRQKIRELLILLIRCLAVAFLALGLAGPVLRPSGGGGGSGGTAAAVVLDDSCSMGALDAEGPIFARARGLTRSILGTLRPGDAACLLTSRRAPVMSRDPGGLASELDRMEPSAGAETLGPLVKAAVKLLRATPAARRELYVISDFQRRAVDFREADLGAPEVSAVVVPVASARRDNMSVAAVEAISSFATPDAPFRVRVVLANHGPESAGRNLKVRVDEVAVAERMVFVPARGSAAVAADLRFDRPGWRTISAELEGDAIPADNRRILPVHVRPKMGALVCREGDGPARRSLYVEKALNPGGQADTGVTVAACGPAELADHDLTGFGVVFLVECLPVGEAAGAALRGYVASGGGLVIVAGPGQDPKAFNEVLGGGDDLGPLSPASFAGSAGGEHDPSGYQSIKEVDPRHPVFARLRRGDAPIDIGSAAFFRIARVEPAERDGARVLARFGGGDPAIVERPFGLGRSVLIASALHSDTTNLPLKVGFLPFLHSLVSYLAQPGGAPGILVGEPLRLLLPRERAPETVRLFAPHADVREASAATSGHMAIFDFGPAESVGTVAFEWSSADRLESRVVAVNVDPDEGSLEREDVKALFPAARVVRDARELAALVGRIRHGRDLSVWLLALAVVAALAESLLANRFAFGRRADLPGGLQRHEHSPNGVDSRPRRATGGRRDYPLS